MNAIGTFLDMGGYAPFVWPAFGLTALVLIGVLLASLRALRRREAALAALREASPARRQAAPRSQAAP